MSSDADGAGMNGNLERTGIEGLDQVLGGGIPQSSIVLLQGESGAGKTTAGLQFLLEGVKAGQSSMIASVSQSASELEVIAESHGLDLSGITVLPLGMEYRRRSEQYTFDTKEAELSDLLNTLYAKLDEEIPDRLVFDSLLELRLLSHDEAAYRREILELKRFLVEKNITVIVIDHLTETTEDRQIEGIVHGVVTMTASTPSIGHTHRQIQVGKFRGHSFVEGFHDYRIKEGGVVVFPRVIPRSLPPQRVGEMLETGDPDFDSMLGGGLEYASTTLISGQSGTGKSTLATLFATAVAAKGKKAAMFLFEERPEVYRERSEGVGLPVKDYEETGAVSFHHFDPAEITAGEFSQTVLNMVEEEDLDMVVIDSLSGYLHSLPPNFDMVPQIHSLMQYLSRRGLLVIVTMAQHGLLGEQPKTDIDLSFLADSVILLRHGTEADEIIRSIAVMKKRNTMHEHRIKEFVISPGRVHIEERPFQRRRAGPE